MVLIDLFPKLWRISIWNSLFFSIFCLHHDANFIGHHNTISENIICFLKEILNKDLSALAKSAFKLLQWTIFWEPHLAEAISVILSSANDSNWRTRSATLKYLQTFMHRYGTSYRGFLPYHLFPIIWAYWF